MKSYCKIGRTNAMLIPHQMFPRISKLIVRDVRLNRFDGNVKILIEMIVISETIFHGLRKNLKKSRLSLFSLFNDYGLFLQETFSFTYKDFFPFMVKNAKICGLLVTLALINWFDFLSFNNRLLISYSLVSLCSF
jgi:hypothetical protein